jgi:membrane-associated phospholipid phosphatase
MRLRSIVLGGALLAGSVTPARAQSVGKMLEYDVKNGVVDMVSIWGTPFHARGRDWLAAAGLVAAGAAISPFDDDVDRWFFRHQHSSAWSVLKELRPGGVAFSGKTITPVIAGLYVVGLATKNTQIRDGVWGCAASYASSSIVRNYVMYQIVGRVRPDSAKRHPPGYVATPSKQGDQYEFDAFPGNDWGKHSLPAGHLANVAACASFLGNRFEMGYFEPVPYLLAAGVGIGRLVDRRHWTSDTFIGAVYGYAVGREVARRSLRRRQQGRESASAPSAEQFFVTPVRGGGMSFGMSWTF